MRPCATAGAFYPPENLAFEQAVIDRHNAERANLGLPPLALSDELTQAARRHSRDMASNNFFSHTGSDGSAPWERMTGACYDWATAGENIAAGYTSPDAVMAGWMASAGHRTNILNANFRDIGVGYTYGANSTFGRYWTVDFGTRQGAAASSAPVITGELALPW